MEDNPYLRGQKRSNVVAKKNYHGRTWMVSSLSYRKALTWRIFPSIQTLIYKISESPEPIHPGYSIAKYCEEVGTSFLESLTSFSIVVLCSRVMSSVQCSSEIPSMFVPLPTHTYLHQLKSIRKKEPYHRSLFLCLSKST